MNQESLNNCMNFSQAQNQDFQKQTFIVLKNQAENAANQYLNELLVSEVNSQSVQRSISQNIENTNIIAEILNKSVLNNPASIEMYQAQCISNIQNSVKMYGMLEQWKANLYQSFSQPEPQQIIPPVQNESTVKRSSNIFVPKPMHVNAKVETTRIGRSHSMFLMNPIKQESSSAEDKSSENDKKSEEISEENGRRESMDNSNLRRRMNVFRCPHTERKHYAKNMCNNCYHKLGRNKKATKCPHKDRQNYAKGKCQNCYLNDYHKDKRKIMKDSIDPTVKDDQDTERKISVETSVSEAVTENKQQCLSLNIN